MRRHPSGTSASPSRRWLPPLRLIGSVVLAGCGQDPAAPGAVVAGAGPMAAAAAPTFRQLAAGSGYTCGLDAAGVISCWGTNGLGQLGDDSRESHATPRPIFGARRYRQIAGGGGHVCAVGLNDRAYCWGWNGTGQLGDGTRADRLRPTAVLGGLTFRRLAAGAYHTCGIAMDDRMYCWGHNKQGQLGDATAEPFRLQPVAVTGGHLFRVVTAGLSHSCGIDLDARAFCWGHGKSGELGNGALQIWRTPRAVSGGHLFRDISAGLAAQSGDYHFTCAVATDNRAYCWGGNIDGQLGDGTTTRRLQPALVKGGLRLATVRAGMGYACGVTTAGAAWCWGRDDAAQLGNGGPLTGSASRSTPVAVSGGLTFQAIRTGWFHACALTTDDRAYCWGSGMLGNGTETGSSSPVPVGGGGGTTASARPAL